jgi:negative regulator of genetic competence, sporulation and motility
MSNNAASWQSFLFSGPAAVAAGALGVVGAIILYDQIEFNTKRPKLKLAMDDIDVNRLRKSTDSESEKANRLLKGLQHLEKYMMEGSDVTDGAETEDHNERRQIVFEFNGLTKLLQVIKAPEFKNNTNVLRTALRAVYILLKSRMTRDVF